MIKVAVAQVGSALFNTEATLARVERMCREAASAGAKLLVLPEALVGGYLRGLSLGATLGNRTDEGRDLYLRYFNSALICPGPETKILEDWARELDLHIVIGIVERGGSTLYCTALVISPALGVILKHRKIMSTGSERLLWGVGDGTAINAVDTEIGRIGVAICWENYMPLYRQHLYDQGVQLWCAPTVDAREIWQASVRHIAYEGRCFVLSPCQTLTKADWPDDLKEAGGEIDGRSIMAGPQGQIIAGPIKGEGLLVAEIDLEDVPRGKFDLDVSGHYSRPDIFAFYPRRGTSR